VRKPPTGKAVLKVSASDSAVSGAYIEAIWSEKVVMKNLRLQMWLQMWLQIWLHRCGYRPGRRRW
jgi:hypothetical protein